MKSEINVNENLLDAETRNKLAGRVEVLDKVKELFLLPELQMMTVQQIANYYEVDFDAVKSCYRRNKDEIDLDGVVKYTPKSLLSRLCHFDTIVKTKYFTDFRLSDDVTLRVPNVGINLFSKRAVLRIGMLLRDSEVAKEVRTHLLNTFEHATDGQHTEDILTEQEIYLNYARAALDGDKEAVLAAAKDAFDFKNRHIKRLEEDNKILAGEILAWSDRASMNKAVRSLAWMAGQPFGAIWNELYTELRYKHGIGLSQRGGAPYIQHVREEEWKSVQQSLAAICEKYDVDIHKVAEIAKLS